MAIDLLSQGVVVGGVLRPVLVEVDVVGVRMDEVIFQILCHCATVANRGRMLSEPSIELRRTLKPTQLCSETWRSLSSPDCQLIGKTELFAVGWAKIDKINIIWGVMVVNN